MAKKEKVFDTKGSTSKWMFRLIAALLLASPLSGQSVSSHIAPWRQNATPVVDDSDKHQHFILARDTVIDSLIGLPKGLTIDGSNGTNVNVTGTRWKIPELPVQSSDAIAVATFASYSVHITSSRRSMYTQANFRIKDAIYDKTKHLTLNNTIPAILLGGTAVLRSGKTVSFGIPKGEYSVVPGHRYLLFLTYTADGQFYEITKSWDLTEGVASPNSPEDEQRIGSGSSLVAGKSESDLVNLVKKQLVR